MLWVKHGAEMIEEITSRFDWVFQMPIQQQCQFAIGLSLFGFIVAAVVRETVSQPAIRNLARAIGAGSFFAVAAFANHASHEWQKLNSELMVRQNQRASEIASESVIAVTTSTGSKVQFGVSEHGVRIGTAIGGSCSRESGSGFANSSADRWREAAGRLGSDGSKRTTGSGGNVALELPEWWRRWVWNDAASADRSAVSFTIENDVKGQSY